MNFIGVTTYDTINGVHSSNDEYYEENQSYERYITSSTKEKKLYKKDSLAIGIFSIIPSQFEIFLEIMVGDVGTYSKRTFIM